ncbi:hypothetical protein FE257_003826 [Aspergillus nanangensis]|uniref:Asp hemolysin-like protein n=1 Tax=Aspergillus nanangensis TaxID=2582783 RepID=A0AAD4CCH2_ASPNN|nr:hypothetical protein FE257_003826 [Aspergillus nanangensis]
MASARPQQYLDIQIQDDLKYDIRIENAHVESGEFYREGDQNDILTTDEIGDMSIRHNGGRRDICSCSEPGAISGPQGAIDLVDDMTDARICTLTWSASLGPGTSNVFTMRNQNPGYKVEIGTWNESGPMGDVPVTISEM